MSNNLNNAGRKFDGISRFTLEISINKADRIGNILRMMASGVVCVFKTLPEAIAAQEEWMVTARAIIAAFSKCGEDVGEHAFSTYGMTAVVDTRDALLHNTLIVA